MNGIERLVNKVECICKQSYGPNMIPRFGVFILVFFCCTIMMEATMEKGQMEAHISTSMITFQRKQLGRGAESAKHILLMI